MSMCLFLFFVMIILCDFGCKLFDTKRICSNWTRILFYSTEKVYLNNILKRCKIGICFQVCPLTALKFAELSHKAGIPAGVINVLPGTGSVCGQAIADHPKVIFSCWPHFLYGYLYNTISRRPFLLWNCRRQDLNLLST